MTKSNRIDTKPAKVSVKAGKKSRSSKKGKGVMSRTKTQNQVGYLPFGVRYNSRLPYVENWPITGDGTTGTSNVTQTYSLNNSYDPRYNTGGHQPFQYDGLASQYERVWDWGAKVELSFSNPEHDGMYVGYRVRASTNPTSTIGKTLDYIQEMRLATCVPMNNSGSQTKKFSFYVNNHKILGILKAQYANIEYSHTVIGNPSIYVWLEPYAIHTVTGQTSTIRANVKITYYSQFTNPTTAPQS